MTRAIILWALGGAVLLASGCVPVTNAQISGTIPAGGTFSMTGPDGEARDVQGRIRARLREQGLRDGANGMYLVQATLAEHRLTSGMAVSDDRQWLHPPERGSGNIIQLNVTVSRATDGTEVFRATSTKRAGRLDAKTMDQLVDAVFISLRKGAPPLPGAARG